MPWSVAISNRASRTGSPGAEGVYTPTEEDAIRRLRSTLFVSIGLTLALGLAAAWAMPGSLDTDDAGPADVASIGEAAGFAISGAETSEDGTVSLHGFAAPGTLVHIGEFITVASDLGTWTLTFETDGTVVTLILEGPDGQLETLTLDLEEIFEDDEKDDEGTGDDDGEEGDEGEDGDEKDDEPVAISVVQKRSSSDSEHPSALFKGTAPAGTGILGSSEFGTEDTRAGEDGTFVLEIPFHDAPIGEPFPITVFVGDEYEFHGEFVWLFEEKDEEPDEDEPKDDPKPVQVTIHQYKGESDSPEPWEKFYGTAPAGTKITISSEFGTAKGYAGSNGEYLVKVWFDGLEETTTFPITVWVGDKKFSFTYEWYAPHYEASANQQYGECEALEPYDVFWGTGTPGTGVLIQSEYGSAELSVNSNGHWEKKVYFPNAPRGVHFPVNVWVGDEKFEFTFEAVEIHHENWAAQKWEIVDGEEPGNKYYGHAEPGAMVVISSEYGSTEFIVGESGEWSKWVSFDPPANTWFPVTVQIIDFYSNTFEMKWVAPVDVEFTAHQHRFESHTLWEAWWGTATPGTKVIAESEYGSSHTYANDDGLYEFGVEFSGVEPGTTFTIWLTNQGETKTFSFTYLGPEGGGEES